MKKSTIALSIYSIGVTIASITAIIGLSNKIEQNTNYYRDYYEVFHGQRVKVVDVMYTYEKDGKTIEGDYSFSVHNGYEYSTDYDYELEYQERNK